jgi:hypothetical protein
MPREKQHLEDEDGDDAMMEQEEEEGEEVMPLMDDADEEEQDAEERAEEKEQRAKERQAAKTKKKAAVHERSTAAGWGKRRAAYYEEHKGTTDATASGEKAEMEEEEAKRLQRIRAETLDEADFTSTTGTAKANTMEKEMVMAMDKELREIGAEQVERDVSSLSREERLRLVAQDSPELAALLADFKAKVAVVRDSLAPLM